MGRGQPLDQVGTVLKQAAVDTVVVGRAVEGRVLRPVVGKAGVGKGGHPAHLRLAGKPGRMQGARRTQAPGPPQAVREPVGGWRPAGAGHPS